MSETTAAALEKLSVAQLKDELTKYGLDTKGKKAVLVERLLEHQSSDLTADNGTEDVNEDGAEEDQNEDGDVEMAEEVREEEEEENDEPSEESNEVAAEASEDANKDENAEGAEETEEAKEGEGDEGEEKKEGEEDEDKDKSDAEQKLKAKPDEFIFDEKVDLYSPKEMVDAEMVYGGLVQDIRTIFTHKKLCAYPVAAEDLADETLLAMLKKCSCYSLHFRAGVEITGTPQGYLEMTLLGQEDVDAFKESFKNWSDEVQLQCGSDIDLPTLAKNDPLFAVPPPKRTICVAGIPENATESQLLELFTGFQAIISRDKDGKANGRGFVEFVNEEEALSAVETGREMTWEEKKIFVFRVWDTPGRDKEESILGTGAQICHKAHAAAQKRMNMVHKWEGHQIDYLEEKIKEIEEMETALEEEEMMREKMGLPAAKRWRQYAKIYLHSRAQTVHSHLKHHVYLTTECLKERLVIRRQRQKDRTERTTTNPAAKKVPGNKEGNKRWNNDRPRNFRGGRGEHRGAMKRPFRGGGGGGYDRSQGYGGNYGDKRQRMGGYGGGYAGQRPPLINSLMREGGWQDHRGMGGSMRGRQYY